MQIRIVEIPTSAGPLHDIVLVQGNNVIKFGMTCLAPELAAAQLKAWVDENTLDVAEIVRGKTTTLNTYKGATHACL